MPERATAVLPIRAIEATVPEANREPPPAGRHLSPWWAVLAVACVLSFVLGWLLHIGRAAPIGLRVTAYTQITYDGAQKNLVGTDGSRLYFDSVSTGPIAQVAVTGGAISVIPVLIPNFAFSEDVSPDGANFLVATDEEGFVLDRPQWNVRVPGGSLRRLPDGGNAAFSPDGNSVAYQTADGGVWVSRSDGSGQHKLASGQRFSTPAAPPEASRPFFGRVAWSPDGSLLRFGNGGRLWEISASGSNLHEVIPGWHLSSSQCCGSWTPDGKLFVFLDTPFGPLAQSEVWARSEGGGLLRRPPAEPVRLATGPIAWGQPIPGKDGKRIFATGKTRRGELLRFDLKTGQFQPFLGGISAQMVSFSKDGQFVAYVSFPEGILWRANRDGSNPVQLTEPPIHALLPRWSPDGTQIVFVDFTTMPTPAYIVAAAGGNPQRLLPEDHESHTDPNWSADGKKIVFSTATPFNPNGNVRILDLATHQITAVAGSERIYSPRWSPDGRFIAAMPVGGNGLKIFNLASQHWSELVQKDSVGFPSWSRDSQFIYFLRILPNGNKGAFRIRVSGGPPERIADLNSIHLGGWWGWVGLDPNDNPLVLRDAGSDDIYALTLERK
jgi:Tol biopolymer transport system component